jgi:hypothetical protein
MSPDHCDFGSRFFGCRVLWSSVDKFNLTKIVLAMSATRSRSQALMRPARSTEGPRFRSSAEVLASVGALPPPNAKGERAKTFRIPAS